MTIQPIANQNIIPINLTDILKQIPHVFEKICSNLDPQTMKDFLSTCKTVRQINNDLKEKYPKTYAKLLARIFPHAFFKKSIEELSDEMISFCRNTNQLQLDNFCRKKGFSDEEIAQYQKLQFLELKDLLSALTVSGKFNQVDKYKLERAFLNACTYTHLNMVGLFVQSDRYHDISVEGLNATFVFGAKRGNGSTIRILINSERFYEITPKSLGKALEHASMSGNPGVVHAIMGSGRAHEISLQDFNRALKNAASYREMRKGTRLKTLRMLMKHPLFNDVSREELTSVFEGAARSWRGDAIQELVQSSRFQELSTKNLNEVFYWTLRNYTPDSVKAIIQSNRFHEISAELQNECNSKPELREFLTTVRSV